MYVSENDWDERDKMGRLGEEGRSCEGWKGNLGEDGDCSSLVTGICVAGGARCWCMGPL